MQSWWRVRHLHSRWSKLAKSFWNRFIEARLPAILTASALVFACSSPVMADDYLLSPQDAVKIRVFEWRPTTGSTFEWTPFNGEFVVTAAGNLLLPIIGSISVSGKTVEQVALTIGESLQSQVGLQRRPDASVEISAYRPFFVTGLVMSPGKFVFSPGLTVVQAVSMAGGSGPLAPNIIALQRDALMSLGDVAAAGEERLRLLARQARVEAVLSNADTVTFPAELTARSKEPEISRIMTEEQELFSTRQESMMTEIDALKRGKDLAAKQIEALEAKAASLAKQTDLASKDLKNVNKLISQGLTVSTREFGANQNVADLESRSLDVSLAILRTQTDLSKVDQDIANVRNRYHVNALTEAADLRDRMSTNSQRVKTGQALINNLEIHAPAALLASGDENEVRYVTTIDRMKNGQMTRISVRDNDLVAPGDVIRVERKPSSPAKITN